MAKFVYRMQNILSLKEKLEEQAKMEYAAQRLKLSNEEEKEEKLKKEKLFYDMKARELMEKKLVIKDIIENAQTREVLKTLISDQHERVKKEAEELEKRRLKLEDVMKERKTQDKLKEKAFEEFKADINYQESKEIDQLTSYVYGNRIRINKEKEDRDKDQ